MVWMSMAKILKLLPVCWSNMAYQGSMTAHACASVKADCVGGTSRAQRGSSSPESYQFVHDVPQFGRVFVNAVVCRPEVFLRRCEERLAATVAVSRQRSLGEPCRRSAFHDWHPRQSLEMTPLLGVLQLGVFVLRPRAFSFDLY